MNTSQSMILAAVVAASLTPACTRSIAYQERDVQPAVVTERGQLVYDADTDVYVVSGYENCYYSAGQYFRRVGSSWEWSVNVESGWTVVSHSSDVPSGLRHKKHGHGKGHDRDDN